jgi:hypothetical protein
MVSIRYLPAIFALTASRPFSNLGINAGLFAAGVMIGIFLVYLGRKVIRRAPWAGYPHALVAIDAVIVVLITAVGSQLEPWKKSVLIGLDAYSCGGYMIMGVLISAGIGSKWLLSLAKEITASRFSELEKQAQQSAKERDIALNAEALIGEVMHAKLSRLANRIRLGKGTLIEALFPKQQIHILIQTLHRHFSKRLISSKRLRIGIYMIAEDGKTLEPAYSWDGANLNCFSNKHRDLMKISNPGGGRSVVVECWLAQEPFIFISDGEASQRMGKFRYFYSGQEKELRSMVAYRHNLSEISASDAFIMTLDSNQADFFSADIESECRLLMPAFSRRIELELLVVE